MDDGGGRVAGHVAVSADAGLYGRRRANGSAGTISEASSLIIGDYSLDDGAHDALLEPGIQGIGKSISRREPPDRMMTRKVALARLAQAWSRRAPKPSWPQFSIRSQC